MNDLYAWVAGESRARHAGQREIKFDSGNFRWLDAVAMTPAQNTGDKCATGATGVQQPVAFVWMFIREQPVDHLVDKRIGRWDVAFHDVSSVRLPWDATVLSLALSRVSRGSSAASDQTYSGSSVEESFTGSTLSSAVS